jgi:transcriptional regulator with XRE-family HTH domain
MLKSARESAALTQQEAACRLGLTQSYLSLLERGRRPVTFEVAAQAMKAFRLPATALPLEIDEFQAYEDSDFQKELGALGYPGFAYLKGKPRVNPALLLFLALDRENLDRRVVEALPWLAFQYYDLDWEWVMRNVKLKDRQNRLGFVLDLAEQYAAQLRDSERRTTLEQIKAKVERARLVREDTLANDSMVSSERRWLRENRPSKARHWNLLTDLTLEHASYVHP